MTVLQRFLQLFARLGSMTLFTLIMNTFKTLKVREHNSRELHVNTFKTIMVREHISREKARQDQPTTD